MLGAIAGDIIGSRFERHNTSREDFRLFTEHSTFTDDMYRDSIRLTLPPLAG